jgi:hypothetical protein
MPINLSIKNAPDEIVLRLKERAAKNHPIAARRTADDYRGGGASVHHANAS